MGGPRIAEEMKKRVIEAYRECGNHSMIARWFGIGDTSVRRICEGVAPRTKSRPFFRKMSPGEYNNREKAEIVREADASRDCVVGAKHGINPKTISTWRNRGFGREKVKPLYTENLDDRVQKQRCAIEVVGETFKAWKLNNRSESERELLTAVKSVEGRLRNLRHYVDRMKGLLQMDPSEKVI